MMKVQKTLGRVRAGSRSSVMSGKAGACLVIKSSLSRYINMVGPYTLAGP